MQDISVKAHAQSCARSHERPSEYKIQTTCRVCVCDGLDFVSQNMVGPGEVDDDLQPEVVEECNKYGEVIKVIIYEVSSLVRLSLVSTSNLLLI